jgi:hypothetical protein
MFGPRIERRVREREKEEVTGDWRKLYILDGPRVSKG